jgi:hypothetical protein
MIVWRMTSANGMNRQKINLGGGDILTNFDPLNYLKSVLVQWSK